MPFTSKKGCKTRTLATSNFLVALKAVRSTIDAVQRDTFLDAVHDLLHSHVGGAYKKTYQRIVRKISTIPRRHHDPANVGETAQYLWTSSEHFNGAELCSILNQTIREDDPSNIWHAVVLSCAINRMLLLPRDKSAAEEFIKSSPIPDEEYPRRLTWGDYGDKLTESRWGCWRGGGFRDEFQSFFTEGKKYRAPGLIATALNRENAELFVNKASKDYPRMLWCIIVDRKNLILHARRVSHSLICPKFVLGKDSYEPMETEFLFAAYSVFTVEKVKWATPNKATGKYERDQYHQIVIRAATDNQESDDALPLAPWY